MSLKAKRKAAIIGVGETQYKTHHPDKTYVELAQEAALKAMQNAGVTPDEIDAVVFSMAPTEFMGVNDAEKWAIDAIAGAGKPFMRVHTGGATGGSAVQAGYLHVASGLYETVLVVGADKVSETPDAQFILGLIWDQFYESDFALNTITMSAFQAVRHMHKYGTTEEQMAHVVVRSWKNAMNNPNAHLKGNLTIDEVLNSKRIAWPIKRYDCCPRSSGAAAVIITSERKAKERSTNPAWINGIGAITNTVFMGDKMGPYAATDHGDWDELLLASKEAYRQAGITNPSKQIDVAELYVPFSAIEMQAVEALGFCEKGMGGHYIADGYFDMDGTIPVNPSGGTLCANPIGVTGLVRVCDAANQIMNQAGAAQVKNVQNAVATAVGGSEQFHTCVVLGADHV
ncbi:thiolase family protein [Neobacillus niacini]|uniref:thiolase family protein n=1 Tax=Neobacillus niacini TaxID=86668 RepID=UPI002FFFE8AC